MRLAIRKYRKLKGVKMKVLAARIGISSGLLHCYEVGTVRVPASRLWDIAQALDVPIQDLFEEDAEEEEALEASLSP